MRRLANCRDRDEPEELEQIEQLASGFLAVDEANLDFFARLGGTRPSRSFVRDPVFVADGPHAERLVSHGEIAGGVFQVDVDLTNAADSGCAERGEPLPEKAVVDGTVFDFHFVAHPAHVRRTSGPSQRVVQLKILRNADAAGDETDTSVHAGEYGDLFCRPGS